jgi:hypothetical protein
VTLPIILVSLWLLWIGRFAFIWWCRRQLNKPIEAIPCRMCCENGDGVPEVAVHLVGGMPLCDEHYAAWSGRAQMVPWKSPNELTPKADMEAFFAGPLGEPFVAPSRQDKGCC